MRPAALLLVAALAPLAMSRADAALPVSPFDLVVAADGGGVTLTVTPRSPSAGAAEAYDLYVMWAEGPRAAFLDATGTWVPRPAAWAQAARVTDGAITRRWAHPGPPGDLPLALVVVAAGGDPLDRGQWRFRPAVTAFRAPGEPARPPLSLGGLVPVVALAGVATVVVLLVPRRR